MRIYYGYQPLHGIDFRLVFFIKIEGYSFRYWKVGISLIMNKDNGDGYVGDDQWWYIDIDDDVLWKLKDM